ncbi:MAG: T9SS type A sorting domain-containing protein [Ignavibacteria bacterium]|nr:T9SS type A sorting domain-containing protein [Ignavibacteria bacterium]
MKTIFLFVCICFFVTITISAQEQKVNLYDPPVPFQSNVEWGTDYLVTGSEPFGRPSGVYRNSTGKIYVSIPDTNISLPGADEGLVILTSTNNGATWMQEIGISPAVVISKTKMISAGPDSLYCFYLVNGFVYSLNVVNGSLNLFTNYTNIRDFDVTSSSTGSLYLIIDLYTNNQVRIFGSANGGVSWGGAIFLSSSAARPGISMSATGDTAVINYYGGPFTDTVSSVIRNVRYRESAPGTLTVAGSFTSPVPAGIPKDQFETVRYGGNTWLFYSEGAPGNMDIKCIYSSDGGTGYGSPFTIGSMPGRDEFWFDAKYSSLSPGGVGLIYYSDSMQAGPPTNSSDKMYYTSALNTDPLNFAAPVHFSDHPPLYSAREYIPTLIEYYDAAGDAGALWVGADGSNTGIYFDRLHTMTGITPIGSEIPFTYSLSQNYPNPFNPVTNLEFAISDLGIVSLKIFNISGSEIVTLVNEKLSPGSYKYKFDGSNYASGVYFYKLTVNNFSETKRMILLK